MKCSGCGATAEGGRFCANCGAAIGTPHCSECGHKPPAGARFCNKCGTAIGGKPARAGTPDRNLVWWMAGALMVGLILVIAYPVYGPGRTSAPPPGAVSSGGGLSDIDLTTMTPREAADRLFNRVMTAVSANDTLEVVNFLPMAIDAFQVAEPLDTDGKFHLVVLLLTGQFNAEALEGSEEILSEQPNHLLGLAVAGDASLALGDTTVARGYYGRWLDAYETEMTKDLAEYQDHSAMFPAMQSTAEAMGRND